MADETYLERLRFVVGGVGRNGLPDLPKHLLIAALLEAANNIEDAPKQEVQALLHRAAIGLRNANSSPNELTLDDALSAAAKDMMLSRQDLVPRILREWLHIKGYLNDSAFNLDGRTQTS